MPKIRPREQLRRLGDRIRSRRLHLNMTRTDVARHVDVSPQMLERYESGEAHPPAMTLARIATALGTSCSVLLGERDPGDGRTDEIAAMTAAFADVWIGSVVRHMLRLPDDKRQVVNTMASALVRQLPEKIDKVEVMT
jgi:transcriptional regulator with XRE-family HTH domain